MNRRHRVAVFADEGSVLSDRIRTASSLSASVLDGPDEKPAVVPDCLVCGGGHDDPVALVEHLDDRYPAVPIVVAPSEGSEALASDVLAAGADDYVPVDRANDLVDRIRTAIDSTTTGPEHGAGNDPAGPTADGGAQREAILAELYDATQELLLATTPGAIATIAVDAASDVLELPVTSVYLLGDDDSMLHSGAHTEAATDIFDDPPPSIPVDDSAAGTTLRNGETRVFEDVRDSPDVHNESTPIRTEIQVPIGDRGVLLTGAKERKEFASYQIDFLELLVTAVEAALKRSERDEELRRYETVFRTVRDRVAVLDADGRFRMANQSLRTMLSVEDLQARTFDAFLESEHPLRGPIGDLAPGESTTLERIVSTEDDRRYPCELGLVALPETAGTDGVVCVVRDISDRKRIRAALEEQRDRFAELFDNVPDPVVELRLDGDRPTVVSVNDSFEATFGCDAESIRGRPLAEFVVPPDADDGDASVDIAATTAAPTEAEVKRETTAGIRHFLFRRIPVETDGDDTLAFGIYTDITDQRTRQRRLEVLNRVLRHNLRNDVNVIVGATEAIEEAADGSPYADLASTARNAATDLARLGEQVRTVGSALDRSGQSDTVRVDRVVDDVVQSYDPREDVALEVSLPDAPLPAVDSRLQIALEQLLDDASAYGNADQVRADIDVAFDGPLRVRIVDHGCGIPETDRIAVERGQETPLEHGSGLGLWLVDWLVTAMGGELQFGDDPKRTVVDLVFPRSVLDALSE